MKSGGRDQSCGDNHDSFNDKNIGSYHDLFAAKIGLLYSEA